MTTNTHGPRLQGVTAKAALAYLKAEEIDHTEAPAALYDWASDNVALGDADDAEILILDWVQDVLNWARTQHETHLDERITYTAVTLLLPSTLEVFDNDQEYEPVTWEDSNDNLGEWNDRDGITNEYLATLGAPFDGMPYGLLARYATAAMRLIREMGYDRAAQIVGRS